MLGDPSKFPALPSPSKIRAFLQERAMAHPQSFIQAAKTLVPSKSPQASQTSKVHLLYSSSMQTKYLNHEVSPFLYLDSIAPEF